MTELGAAQGIDLAIEDGEPEEPRRRRWLPRRGREALLGYALLLPALAVFVVFIFYPFLKNFELALYRTAPFPGLPDVYVGLDQFGDVLGSSAVLEQPLGHRAVRDPHGSDRDRASGSGLAVLAHQKLKGMAIYRTIFSSTVATSVAVASVIFGTLFNAQVGLLPVARASTRRSRSSRTRTPSSACSRSRSSRSRSSPSGRTSD